MNFSIRYIENPKPGFLHWILKLKLASGVTWHCDFSSIEEAL